MPPARKGRSTPPPMAIMMVEQCGVYNGNNKYFLRTKTVLTVFPTCLEVFSSNMTSSKWFNCNACSLTHVTTSILAGLEVVQVHIVTAAFGDCSFGIDSDTLADRVRHYGKALAELIYKAKYEGIVLDLGADKEYARYFCGFVVFSQQRRIPKASFPGVIVVDKGKEGGWQRQQRSLGTLWQAPVGSQYEESECCQARPDLGAGPH